MKPELSMEAVRDLAFDVWEDLGRTRLAGVAVGLVLAFLLLVGVTLRPGGAPDIASGSPAPMTATPENEVSFTVPGDKPLSMSDVDLSAPRDPFRSLDGLAASDGQTLLPAGEEIVDSVTGPARAQGPRPAGSARPMAPARSCRLTISPAEPLRRHRRAAIRTPTSTARTTPKTRRRPR